MCVCVCVLVAQLCPTRPPGISVHGILQARILEWIAILFSRDTFYQMRNGNIIFPKHFIHQNHVRLLWHSLLLETLSSLGFHHTRSWFSQYLSSYFFSVYYGRLLLYHLNGPFFHPSLTSYYLISLSLCLQKF